MTKNNWSSKPLSVDKAVSNLSKYDAIWCAQLVAKHNPRAWNYLRKNKPELLMFYYISGCSVQINGSFTFLDYDYINNNHPEWFLLADNRNVKPSDYKDHNKRIRWNPSDKNHSYYNRFFLDVGNKEFQSWAINQILNRISASHNKNLSFSYDGLAMDNVLLVAWHKMITKRHPHWKYASDPDVWNKTFFDYLKTIRDQLKSYNLKLVINHTTNYGSNREGDEWKEVLEFVDGIMDEWVLGPPRQEVWGGERWNRSLNRHEEGIRRGLADWWLAKPFTDEKSGYEQFKYIYCSFLLIKEHGQSFFYSTKGKHDYANPEFPWYDEYDLPIGKATSKRYLRNNCWFRDYANAKVVVNPTNKVQRVVIDQQKLWLDWSSKETISELELLPRSGRILLPTPYKIKAD